MEKGTIKKLAGSLALLVILVCTIVAGFYILPNLNARAIITSPRLGVPLRGPAVRGINGTSDVVGQIEIQLAVEPLDVAIPNLWFDHSKWKVILVPSVFREGISFSLDVQSVKSIENPSIFVSEGLDTSAMYQMGVAVVCDVHDALPPLLYDIVIGFNAPETQLQQYLSSYQPKPGSWKSESGLYRTSFIISESSCLYFPWKYDAESFDGEKYFENQYKVNPFTILHVTDTHYTPDQPNISGNNSGWEFDSKILAPELIIISGDLMENPAKKINEYDIAYQRLINLGSPVLITSGNHDQKNLGPWAHYFGSSFGSVIWSDVKITFMTNVLPIGTSVFEYLDNQFKENPKSVNLFTFHYPPEPNYAGASWISLLQMALSNDVDAILAGHMHIDAVAPIEELISLSTINEGRAGMVRKLVSLSEQREYLGPITRPYLILTRSAAKPSGSISEYVVENGEEDIQGYSAYRRLVIQNNKIINYTYDYNNSGIRDAHNSIPVGRFNSSIAKDPNFGIDPTAKAYISLHNSMNEFIPSARIPIMLEKAPNGKIWNPIPSNSTKGVYIRSSISNATYTWLDIRAPLTPYQNITITIEMANGG